MGWFKKVTKAVSKAVKSVSKSAENVVKGAAAVATGNTGENKTVIQEAAPVETAPATAPAQAVETPKDESVQNEADNTESDKRKAASSGKRSLSIARSSGSGINI